MVFDNRSSSDAESAFSKYADMLYRVCLSYLPNDADAEDAVQDTFIKYMTKAPVFFSHDHEKAWLLRVAQNRCKDILKREGIKKEMPLEEAYNVASEDEEAKGSVLALVRALPESYRSVVVLHCLEGYPLGEVARILKISLSASKMRLKRAREILKNLREEDK